MMLKYTAFSDNFQYNLEKNNNFLLLFRHTDILSFLLLLIFCGKILFI